MSLADCRERGWPLAALDPFDESFHARYGWATGERYWTTTVEPTDADRTRASTLGRCRLSVGHRGIERARADSDLVVHDADAAGTLARSFPRRETFLPEQF